LELVSNSIDVNEVQKLWGSKAHWKILDSIDVAVECPRCTYQPHNEIDERSAETVKSLYLSMCDNRPRAVAMSLINAEIAKLSLNCFVTMKISFANELASICEKIPGADIDAVTDALGADTRIGPKYLKAGLGFGGTCFPRDNLAFQAFAGDSGMNARLGTAVVQINHSVVDRLFNMIYRKAESGGKIALLGLSYKPGT